ncbi:uncharacterized protein MELLADRAFT_90970 [Melampsora larici-populina 98AG31]|uniref:Uncharacterized protein n=1 Tax=Melampsora larici-populina (strain 98AG31 / pathotype 3-4-7) TaxID=747676 RepID=F4R878_MELLP|nr:uncharacterized protein MELLADRAFT_90970 [Melampsora larici-populina 98AG31]EGG11661.1 hypothetical protein MELLADRAFT_90970 [Melampsora larici-populina 98AG31]
MAINTSVNTFLKQESSRLGLNLSASDRVEIIVTLGDFEQCISPNSQVNCHLFQVNCDPLSRTGLLQIGDDVAGASDTWSRVVRTINQFASEAWANEPGTFADLDLLKVGQGGLTRIEVITQFTFWAAAK